MALSQFDADPLEDCKLFFGFDPFRNHRGTDPIAHIKNGFCHDPPDGIRINASGNAHGDFKKLSAGAQLAQEMGYVQNKTVHIMQNGQALTI